MCLNSQRVSCQLEFLCQFLTIVDSDAFFSFEIAFKEVALRCRQISEAALEASILFFELVRGTRFWRLYSVQHFSLVSQVFMVNIVQKSETTAQRIVKLRHAGVNSDCNPINDLVGEAFRINTTSRDEDLNQAGLNLDKSVSSRVAV